MPKRIAFLIASILLIASCGATGTAGPNPIPSATASPNPSAAAAFPASVTDFQNRSVAISKRPERIVSIGPSNTEFLFALGAGERVVGDDDFSDEPAAAKAKEHVGGVKVNLEKVASLRPDLIVTVKFSDGTVEALTQLGAAVLVVDPQGLPDVAKTAVLLGQAVGADGRALAADIQKQLDAVSVKTRSAAKPRVFHEVDASDLTKMYTVGPRSFIDDLITVAGGVNIAAGAKTQYPTISAEEVVKADPEVVILGDSAYGTTVDQVVARPGWSAMSAVKSKRVYPVPGNLFNRPGPRVGLAALEYAKLVHPELYR
jgi:iron complex transport system substrate-binding protein